MIALKRNSRISGIKEINETTRGGRRITTEAFVAHINRSKTAESRAVIVISKKIDKRAVVRNKLRRRISEILRECFSKMDTPVDVVIHARPEIKNFNFNQLLISLKNVLACDSF